MRARLISFALHLAAATAGFLLPYFVTSTLPFSPQRPLAPVLLKLAPLPMPPRPRVVPADPGAGGGTQDETPASRGRLPLVAKRKFLLPLRPTVAEPQLVVEPTIDIAVPVMNANYTQIGVPWGLPGPPSGGRGKGGFGSDGEGGVGKGDGPGFSMDSGRGALIGPKVLYQVEPEFSDEARRAKVQGTVVVEVVIGTDGKAHEVRVVNGLGLGLDERAIEAVSKWRFRPASRGGRPLATSATVYVNFRLL